MLKATFLGTIAGLGILLGTAPNALGLPTQSMSESTATTSPTFRRIEQPVSHKVAVTLSGLGLMGLELWWFLLSKPKAQQANLQAGIQEVTVTVDGGYQPSRIVVQAGQPVRLNFFRRDPNGCLEEVRLPDFHIARNLPLNQVETVEFTPTQSGNYEFTCGMNMFRGVVEVQPVNS